MSELDTLVKEGCREPEDFQLRGYDPGMAEAMADIAQRDRIPSRRHARLEKAVRLILAIDEAPDESNPETIKLSPMSRRQLQEALK